MQHIGILALVFVAVFLGVFALASIANDIVEGRLALRRKLREIAALDSGQSGQRWTVRRR